MKINNISISDPSFGAAFTTIAEPPKQLFYLGNVQCKRPTIAIVGTRKPTTYGQAVTRDLAERLASRGCTIVSGLALGIDSIAHQATLDAGGHTVAVLAHGLDSITPASKRNLAIAILENQGGLLSEYEAGTPALAYRFLERNRLVSALADAVVVTEATLQSGTMNTVMHALGQGKDVYAIPGNITSPSSAGCNRLIEQGATPITNIEAFVEQTMPSDHSSETPLLLGQTSAEQAIITLIRNGVSDGEELQKQSQLDAVTFSTTLSMLELRGAIHGLGANHWGI